MNIRLLKKFRKKAHEQYWIEYEPDCTSKYWIRYPFAGSYGHAACNDLALIKKKLNEARRAYIIKLCREIRPTRINMKLRSL